MFLFYFITGFIVIRIWIILIESQDIYVEISGAAVTFIMLLLLCLRYRRYRRLGQAAANRAALDPNIIGGGDGQQYPAGLPQEMIDSLNTFPFRKNVLDTNGLEMGVIRVKPDISAGSPTSSGEKYSNTNQGESHATGGSINPRYVAESDIILSSDPAEQNVEAQRAADKYIADSFLVCTICLEEYEEGVMMMQLPCHHQYHHQCVQEWLRRHSTCPLCKQDIRQALNTQVNPLHQQPLSDRGSASDGGGGHSEAAMYSSSSTGSMARGGPVSSSANAPFAASTSVGTDRFEGSSAFSSNGAGDIENPAPADSSAGMQVAGLECQEIISEPDVFSTEEVHLPDRASSF